MHANPGAVAWEKFTGGGCGPTLAPMIRAAVCRASASFVIATLQPGRCVTMCVFAQVGTTPMLPRLLTNAPGDDSGMLSE